jgi:hypothetical protein
MDTARFIYRPEEEALLQRSLRGAKALRAPFSKLLLRTDERGSHPRELSADQNVPIGLRDDAIDRCVGPLPESRVTVQPDPYCNGGKLIPAADSELDRLEAVSSIAPQQNLDAAEMHEAEKVLDMITNDARCRGYGYERGTVLI